MQIDVPKGMEEARGVICSVCRNRLSTAIVDCPACQAMGSFLRRHERSNSREQGDGKVCSKWLGDKIASKIKRRDQVIKVTPESLNCKPSPLDASESSSEGRPPRKRALLIGVTYRDKKHRLKGTVNDVMNMRTFLIDYCGFRRENILVLTEKEPEPKHIPIKTNILKSLPWLVKGCREGDSLVFYFSGHGVRQPDFDGDERDGFDETICPADFMTEGLIYDNEINSTLVWPLKKGVTLHAIIDACHSGTMLDLLFVYDRNKKTWEDNSPPSGLGRKYTDGGLAISISACEDSQLAADTAAFTGNEMNGAMTHILIETLKKLPGPTYATLLDIIYQRLEDVNKNAGLPARILNRIFHNKILQKPQLSASEPFDVDKKHIYL